MAILKEFRSKKVNKIDEKRCLGKPKWKQNRSKKGPKSIQMATWSDIGCGNRKKRYHPAPSRTIWLHFGSQMGAKLEPKVVKRVIKNPSKFEVDLKMHFTRKRCQNRANMEPDWSQQCFQMHPGQHQKPTAPPPAPLENCLDQHWATSSTGNQLGPAWGKPLHRITAWTSIGPPAPRQPTSSITFETTVL